MLQGYFDVRVKGSGFRAAVQNLFPGPMKSGTVMMKRQSEDGGLNANS